MSTTPRAGKFSQDVTVTWSDGTLFTGYAYIGLVPPTYGASDDAEWCSIGAFGSAQSRVPDRIPVPIIQGKYNNTMALWFTADLVPPNSRYQMKLYDATKRSVSSFSSSFSVSSDPFTPPTITPTAPSVGSNVPQPN